MSTSVMNLKPKKLLNKKIWGKKSAKMNSNPPPPDETSSDKTTRKREHPLSENEDNSENEIIKLLKEKVKELRKTIKSLQQQIVDSTSIPKTPKDVQEEENDVIMEMNIDKNSETDKTETE